MNDSICEAFAEHLTNRGYKVTTDSGKPSTVYSYVRATRRIAKEEGITICELKKQIDYYVRRYDIGGIKEFEGKRSNSTMINALKRFEEFQKQ